MFSYQAVALSGSAANAATSARGRAITISVRTSTGMARSSSSLPVRRRRAVEHDACPRADGDARVRRHARLVRRQRQGRHRARAPGGRHPDRLRASRRVVPRHRDHDPGAAARPAELQVPRRGRARGLPRPRRRVPRAPRRRGADPRPVGLRPLRGRDAARVRRGGRRAVLDPRDRRAARAGDARLPVDERAARHGASSPVSTDDGDEAYADWEGGPPPGRAPQVTAPWPPG